VALTNYCSSRGTDAPCADVSQQGSLRHRQAGCQVGTAWSYRRSGPVLPPLGEEAPWYVRRALKGRRAQGRQVSRAALAGVLGCVAAVGPAACGGAQKRQDEDEPKGNFPVQVVEAEFPERQKLAKRSELNLVVRNAGRKTIPNVAVTVDGFYRRVDDPDLADPNRPIFVINGQPKEIGGFPESKEAAPEGGETAYVSTWALGKLKPDAEKRFRWSVTAVKSGPFRIKYSVAAGLDGKAQAVDASGGRPVGVFSGTISDAPPDTRVAEDGETVISGTR
jgi:hypothetical protein